MRATFFLFISEMMSLVILSGFDLFARVVQKVINDNQAGPYGMAEYFWRQLTPSFRFRCVLVTTECHRLIDPDSAVDLLSQMLHMQYQPPLVVIIPPWAP